VTGLAGVNQDGHVYGIVAVAPAVLVRDQFGNPVAGVSVAFAVTTGGGMVTGSTPVTNASGMAAVGSWILGGLVAQQQLSATAQGLPGNPVTFTANAAEFILQPTADTLLTGGVLRVSRLIIPPGRTITTTGPLVLEADLELRIDGTLLGPCVAISLQTPVAASISGLLDNGCEAAGTLSPLSIAAGGGYSLSGATIEAGGDVLVSTDVAPALRRGFTLLTPWQSALESSGEVAVCELINADLGPAAQRARNGSAATPDGADGGNGIEWTVECSGDLRILGNVTIKGQSGGDGGAGTHSSAILASATGGAGGHGGITRLVSQTGAVVFSGAGNRIETGLGGNGGAAEATALPALVGAKAPEARAEGGPGGTPGALDIQTATGTVVQAPFEIVVGPAGRGGDAVARGADGQAATATQAAQAGGDAEAIGGLGGDTPEQVFATSTSATGSGVTGAGSLSAGAAVSFSVIGGELVTFIAAPAGDGGHGEVVGGNGGNGGVAFPDGGAGGDMTVAGGNGGSATVKDLQNVGLGTSGDGGNASVTKGNGGMGADRCVPPLAGGKGGNGGKVAGQAGSTGMVLPSLPGINGTMSISDAANGGDGGDGAGPGAGGLAGLPPLLPYVEVASFDPGAPGGPCPGTIIVTVIALGQPLEGALVVLSGPSPGTETTGPDGRAIFPDRNTGSYGVLAHKAGYMCNGTTVMVVSGQTANVTVPCSPFGAGPGIELLPGFYIGPGSAVFNGCMMAPGGTFGPTIIDGPGAGQLTWSSFVDIVASYLSAFGGFIGSSTSVSGPIEVTESVDGTFDLSGMTPRFRGLLTFRERNLMTNAECTTIYQITVLRQIL
jgi:hypothetical protein